jgi:endonuclease III
MSTLSPLTRGASARLAVLDALLESAYRTPEAALGNKTDPLDEAIYIILSFQTDVPRITNTWKRLKDAYPSWDLVDRSPLSAVANALREGGLHRQKARTIKQLLAELRTTTGSLSLDHLHALDTASAERALLKLPGFSWKSARCVLLYSLNRNVFPIDSNTFRILKRIGVLRDNAVYRRKPLHDKLQAVVSEHRRRALHVNLVVHGQRTCLPRAPRCGGCPVHAACSMKGIGVEQ